MFPMTNKNVQLFDLNDFDINNSKKTENNNDSDLGIDEKIVKKKKKSTLYENNDFIDVSIVYYFEWTCPNCKTQNVQRYKNIFDCIGPDWASKSIECKKCKMFFAIRENYGSLYRD